MIYTTLFDSSKIFHLFPIYLFSFLELSLAAVLDHITSHPILVNYKKVSLTQHQNTYREPDPYSFFWYQMYLNQMLSQPQLESLPVSDWHYLTQHWRKEQV